MADNRLAGGSPPRSTTAPKAFTPSTRVATVRQAAPSAQRFHSEPGAFVTQALSGTDAEPVFSDPKGAGSSGPFTRLRISLLPENFGTLQFRTNTMPDGTYIELTQSTAFSETFSDELPRFDTLLVRSRDDSVDDPLNFRFILQD